MRKIELRCHCKADAIELVRRRYGITVIKDLTPSWKAAGKPLSDPEFPLFIARQLEKYDIEGEGLGIIIILKPGYSKNICVRTKFSSHKGVWGNKNFKLAVGIFEAESNVCLETTPHRCFAKKLMRKWLKKLKTKIVAKLIHVPIEDNTIYELEYTDKTKMTMGEYIVVGFSKWLK